MNEDLDDQYRRASAADRSRPSDAARAAILEYAQRVAADNGVKRVDHEVQPGRRSRRRAAWLYAVGSLAAAVFAGLLVTPIFRLQTGGDMLRAAGGTPATGGNPAVVTADADASRRPVESAETAAQPAVVEGAARQRAQAPVPAPGARLGKPAADSALAASRDTLSFAQRKALSSSANAAGAVPPPSNELNGSLAGGADARAETQAAAQAQRRVHALDQAQAQTPSPDQARAAEALRRAADVGDVAAAQRLLEGADVALESRDASGRTALMLATLNGRTQLVEMLLARGADPKAQDRFGQTPLAIARARNLRDIRDALERAGGP